MTLKVSDAGSAVDFEIINGNITGIFVTTRRNKHQLDCTETNYMINYMITVQ